MVAGFYLIAAIQSCRSGGGARAGRRLSSPVASRGYNRAVDDGTSRAAAELARAHRTRWLNWFVPLVIVVVVLGGAALYAVVSSALAAKRGIGDPCEQSSDCTQARSFCLIAAEGSMCTLSCEHPTDCPNGWRCALTDVVNKAGGRAGTMTTVCVKK
jgi:hypothetical protein